METLLYTVNGQSRFSALQRAEIAEIVIPNVRARGDAVFQCSSTSRNC